MINLSIIIVNYNAKGILSQCLNSIYENTSGINFEIFVVDNNSKDGSSQMLKQDFPQVKLIQNRANLGLTRAQNQGLNQAEGKYILLLNNDTLIQPLSISKLVDFMDETPLAGIAGPRIYTNSKPQISFAWFPKNPCLFLLYILLRKIFLRYGFKKRHYDFSEVLDVDYVCGACLMIRKTVIEKIGLMDEGYFVYNEDEDLCLRVKQNNYHIYFVTQAGIIHYGQKGGGQLHPYRMIIEIHKGIFRLYKKFYHKRNKITDCILLLVISFRAFILIILKLIKRFFRFFDSGE